MNNNLKRLIKQSQPFTSAEIQAQVGFMYLSYLLNSNLQVFFKSFGITPQQYNILRILRGQRPKASNINLIKDRMLDKMSDVSRIIDRLLKQDLVTKDFNMIDKRNVDVMITEKALLLLREIDIKMLSHKTPITKLTRDEQDLLNELIDKLLEGIE